jgi:orotidine-5'-phosphate decarboxylase
MELFEQKNGVIIDLGYLQDKFLIDAIDATNSIPFVVGYKIGALPVLEAGLKDTLRSIRKISSKPLLYDHQKLGSDLPDIYKGRMLDLIKSYGANGVFLFPLGGKEVLEAIINKCIEIELIPVVCGDLSYKGFFAEEGGYIDIDVQQRIYLDAASYGVSHFMMSCNRVDRIKIYCHQLGGIIGQLKLIFTGINSADCNNLPDSCSQLKHNKAFALFDDSFSNTDEYVSALNTFWEGFKKKLEITSFSII